MLKIKTTNVALSCIIVLTGIMAPLFCTAGNAEHKIKVDTEPHYIRANQSFKLVFTFRGPQSHYKFLNGQPITASPIAAKLQTTDFTIIDRGDSKTSDTTINGKRWTLYTYTYKLVPKRSGNLVIAPWTAKFDSALTYASDTFVIHVYNERISIKDSLAKIQELYRKSNELKAIDIVNQQNASLPPGTVHFLHADSSYNAEAGQEFFISYEIFVANVKGGLPDIFNSIVPDKLKCPSGLEELSSKWGGETTSMSLINGKLSTSASRPFVITLRAKKSGNYKLPQLRFIHGETKYTAPPIKIVVK